MHRGRPQRAQPLALRNHRNEKPSLATILITKVHTNPLAQSRSTADSGDQSPASGPSISPADCRWDARGQGSSLLWISWGARATAFFGWSWSQVLQLYYQPLE